MFEAFVIALFVFAFGGYLLACFLDDGTLGTTTTIETTRRADPGPEVERDAD